MLANASWIKKPVPNLTLDEKSRLFISVEKTMCINLRNITDPEDDVIVEYDNSS